MKDFFYDHPALTAIALFLLIAAIIAGVVSVTAVVVRNQEIEKAIRIEEAKAKICQETGYGCHSSDVNIDYQNNKGE